MKFTLLFSMVCYTISIYAQSTQPLSLQEIQLLNNIYSTNHSLNSRGVQQKLDSTRVIQYDAGTQSWETSTRTQFEYYTDGSIKKQTSTTFNALKETMEFNTNGKILLRVSQNSNGSVFENDTKTLYTYDSQGLPTSDTNYTWNGTNWDITGYSVYQNDAQGFIEQKTNFQTLGGTTIPNTRFSFINNPSGKVLNLITFQYINGTWENHYNYHYSYNIQSRMTEFYYQIWDSGNWQNQFRSEISFVNNDQTLIENYYWDNSNWVLDFKQESQYDTDVLSHSFWLPQNLKNNDHMIVGTQSYFYNGLWGYLDSTMYFYSDVTPNSTIFIPSDTDYKILTNPVTTELNIDNPSSLDSHIKVYSFNGQLVKMIHSKESIIHLDVNELPSGLYFVDIHNSIHNQVFNIIKSN